MWLKWPDVEGQIKSAAEWLDKFMEFKLNDRDVSKIMGLKEKLNRNLNESSAGNLLAH